MFLPPANNASIAWYAMLKLVVEQGNESQPRGKKIYELLGTQLLFDMSRPVVEVKERKLSYTFMTAEALWILSGSDKLEDIEPYNKNLRQYSDNGRTFAGAYGPPVTAQLSYVAHKLTDDIDSRQAVMTIWRQNPEPSKDVPCTLALQFLIRDNKIQTIATMRSSDIWLGLPYDMFTFTAITIKVARLINYIRGNGNMVELGSLMICAGSSHVYFDDLEQISNSKVLTNEVACTLTRYSNKAPADITIPCRCQECKDKLLFDKHDQFTHSLIACRDRYEESIVTWRIRPE